MRRLACLLGMVAALGCTSSRAPLRPPAVSPASAAREAMAAYDGNKDGFLEGAELDKCPALKSALEYADQNGDKKLSQQEIEDRINSYLTSGVGLLSTSFTVYLDRQLLTGATVTLKPEPFLGDAIKPAHGVTDDVGGVSPEIEGSSLGGMHFGLYKIVISKKDANGKETIPAKYNTNTTLGQEIAPDRREGAYTLNLTRR